MEKEEIKEECSVLMGKIEYKGIQTSYNRIATIEEYLKSIKISAIIIACFLAVILILSILK